MAEGAHRVSGLCKQPARTRPIPRRCGGDFSSPLRLCTNRLPCEYRWEVVFTKAILTNRLPCEAVATGPHTLWAVLPRRAPALWVEHLFFSTKAIYTNQLPCALVPTVGSGPVRCFSQLAYPVSAYHKPLTLRVLITNRLPCRCCRQSGLWPCRAVPAELAYPVSSAATAGSGPVSACTTGLPCERNLFFFTVNFAQLAYPVSATFFFHQVNFAQTGYPVSAYHNWLTP